MSFERPALPPTSGSPLVVVVVAVLVRIGPAEEVDCAAIPAVLPLQATVGKRGDCLEGAATVPVAEKRGGERRAAHTRR